MFHAVICTVKTGQVERKTFETWTAAREYIDAISELLGRRVRVSVERVDAPKQPQPSSTGRSIAA